MAIGGKTKRPQSHWSQMDFQDTTLPNGSKCKHKAILQGYAQQHGVDYHETFALIARHDTIRLLITFACSELLTNSIARCQINFF